MIGCRRAICLLLAAVLLVSLAACSAVRGRTERYDGFTVKTEKGRELEPAAEDAPTRNAQPETAEDYVLNKSSKKFHYPTCTGVKDMKEKNRWDYHGTRQSVIDLGYQPCKICNP